jgi:hypothetical protein
METMVFYIFIFVISTILILALLSNGVVSPPPNETLVKTVIIEGLEQQSSSNNEMKLDEAFCNAKYSLIDINKKCKSLSDKNCSLVNCCVFLNGEKCVGGSSSGPTYLSENGENIDVKYYRHKTKVFKSL